MLHIFVWARTLPYLLIILSIILEFVNQYIVFYFSIKRLEVLRRTKEKRVKINLISLFDILLLWREAACGKTVHCRDCNKSSYCSGVVFIYIYANF